MSRYYRDPTNGDLIPTSGQPMDTKNQLTTFTSSDVADGSATSWTSVNALTSGEQHKNIFAKISQMFKNIRYLYKMLGTTDISGVSTSGTVTDGLSTLNNALNDKIKYKDLAIGVNLASLKAHHQNIDSDTTLAPIQSKIFAARVIGCPTNESISGQFICNVSSKSNGTGVNINILNIYEGTLSGTLYVRVYYYT